VNREALSLEQPPFDLLPNSIVLKGHSIDLEKEGLIYSLYDYINHTYLANKLINLPDLNNN